MNAAITSEPTFRIGIDLGGTKIEGIALASENNAIAAGPIRIATPANDYAGTIAAIGNIVVALEQQLGLGDMQDASVGVGIPGSVVRATGLIQNANSTWLNQRPFRDDLASHLRRPVRLANDANCFALSEATDGAGRKANSVFGVILGTGCGGGLVVGRKLIDGPLGVAGEWGHNPLPWSNADEMPGHKCWCGRSGCIETWVSGPALERHYRAASGLTCNVAQISERARSGDPTADIVVDQHLNRLARGLAHVVNVFDPDMVVLGGGLSKLDHLYRDLPDAMAPHLFADHPAIDIRPPSWGDSSGVRGAAWLWNN